MQNDISYDWINNVPQELGAEGSDIGNGNSADYGGDSIPNIKPEDIAPESELPVADSANKKNIPGAGKNTPQPKAIMPKKDPPGGQRK